MNNLYFDCTNGIAGDMVLGALIKLGAEETVINRAVKAAGLDPDPHEDGHHHKSYRDIKQMIAGSALKESVKETALSVYAAIAKGEAQVHGTTVEDVQFHEVGRDRAIANIVGIAAALDNLHIKEIYCSEIHDGKGFIDCSHGRIPVPVPAVMAMRQDCDYPFVTDDVETEMVTPSGLGILMGIKARYAEKMPAGKAVKTVEVKGQREIGKGGLKVSLIETG